MTLRFAVIVVLINCQNTAKFQIFCIYSFVATSISMCNFDLFIARFLQHLQKFNNIHNAAPFPGFPLIPTPLLCNQHKPLQKNHDNSFSPLCLTFHFHAIYYNIAKTTRKGILLAFNTSMKLMVFLISNYRYLLHQHYF